MVEVVCEEVGTKYVGVGGKFAACSRPGTDLDRKLLLTATANGISNSSLGVLVFPTLKSEASAHTSIFFVFRDPSMASILGPIAPALLFLFVHSL